MYTAHVSEETPTEPRGREQGLTGKGGSGTSGGTSERSDAGSPFRALRRALRACSRASSSSIIACFANIRRYLAVSVPRDMAFRYRRRERDIDSFS